MGAWIETPSATSTDGTTIIHSLTIHEMKDKERSLFPSELFSENKGNGETIRYCRTCVHRKRYALNDYSSKVVQCCDRQRSKYSNSGYKTIKVTDMACLGYVARTCGD